jgi:hypothetical protein
MFYKESKNFITKKELDIIQESVLGNSFPWYYQPKATTDKFQFFSHTLIPRYDLNTQNFIINSPCFNMFYKIFNKFCNKHKIKFNKITRACMNLTSHHNEYQTGDPHVDHDFEHKVFMIYLNKTKGDTIIYDEKFNGNVLKDINKKYKILKSIKPEIGKAVCWDGTYYHAASYPECGNRRVVLVMTFI